MEWWSTHFRQLILALAVIGLTVSVSSQAVPSHAQTDQAEEGSGAVRATVHLLQQEEEKIAEPSEEADACPDLHEKVSLSLRAPGELQAAYARIDQKALLSIPVDDGILNYLAQGIDEKHICGKGCETVQFSAQCLRSSLQKLEDCLKGDGITSCEVEYDCSVACTEVEPEKIVKEAGELYEDVRGFWNSLWSKDEDEEEEAPQPSTETEEEQEPISPSQDDVVEEVIEGEAEEIDEEEDVSQFPEETEGEREPEEEQELTSLSQDGVVEKVIEGEEEDFQLPEETEGKEEDIVEDEEISAPELPGASPTILDGSEEWGQCWYVCVNDGVASKHLDEHQSIVTNIDDPLEPITWGLPEGSEEECDAQYYECIDMEGAVRQYPVPDHWIPSSSSPSSEDDSSSKDGSSTEEDKPEECIVCENYWLQIENDPEAALNTQPPPECDICSWFRQEEAETTGTLN